MLEDQSRINSGAEVLVLDSILNDATWIWAAEAVTLRSISLLLPILWL
jgi:hypothetical protein